MKKRTWFPLLLALLLLVTALPGCGGTANTADTGNAPPITEPQRTESSPAGLERPPLGTQSSSEATESQQQAPAGEPISQPSEAGRKLLVVYFSATGTTSGVAKTIAQALDGDLYEIIPEVPYTSDDLNYNDAASRSTKEQNDATARPAISGSVENWEQYDTVLIGYPIWWNDTPRIINTFADSYDFTGKTVTTFCTSGGSGISGSEQTLKRQISAATFQSGMRFSADASQQDALDWAASIGLDENGTERNPYVKEKAPNSP